MRRTATAHDCLPRIDLVPAAPEHARMLARSGALVRTWRRAALVLASSVGALLGAEGLLRWLAPAALFVSGRDTEGWTENTPTFDTFMQVDATIGYLPRRGTALYDERGLCRDQSADQALPTGPLEVLWLGDSVTARRFIEREVRRQSSTPFTSRCGGVEGYNTAQTLGYYQRELRSLRPAQVVFTLHHNDWWNTPIVFYDDEGRVHCRTLDRQVSAFSPWWFEHSYLYRAGFSLWLGAAAEHAGAAADRQVEQALRGLRDLLAADRVACTVLLLPPMRPETAWSEAERQRHERARALLTELGLEFVDLLPGLRAGLAAGIDPQQLPNDWMHPSEAIAVHLAAEVVRAGVVPRR